MMPDKTVEVIEAGRHRGACSFSWRDVAPIPDHLLDGRAMFNFSSDLFMGMGGILCFLSGPVLMELWLSNR